MAKLKDSIWLQLLPLFLLIVIFSFTHNEIIVTVILAILIAVTFAIMYYRGEWKVFLLGIIVGLAFELGGNLVYKAQYWSNASLFGIPLWLPLMWGYGFIFIRRIGNLLIGK